MVPGSQQVQMLVTVAVAMYQRHPPPAGVCPPLGLLEPRLGIRSEAGLRVVTAFQAPLPLSAETWTLGVSEELGPTLHQEDEFPLAIWPPVLGADLGSQHLGGEAREAVLQ